MKKVRIAKLIVLPVVYVDDGENLVEIDVEQMVVPGDHVEEFVNGGLSAALDSLRAQFETDRNLDQP